MDEILKRDQNFVTVLAGVTNDADQDIRMLRVDPITKRLLVTSSISGGVVTSLNGLTGAITLVAGSNITITPSGQDITISSTGGSSFWSRDTSGDPFLYPTTDGDDVHINSTIAPDSSQLLLESNGLGALDLLSYAPGDQEIHFDTKWTGGDYKSTNNSSSMILVDGSSFQIYADDEQTIGSSTVWGGSPLFITSDSHRTGFQMSTGLQTPEPLLATIHADAIQGVTIPAPAAVAYSLTLDVAVDSPTTASATQITGPSAPSGPSLAFTYIDQAQDGGVQAFTADPFQSQFTGSGGFIANGQTITWVVYGWKNVGGVKVINPNALTMTLTDPINDGTTIFYVEVGDVSHPWFTNNSFQDGFIISRLDSSIGITYDMDIGNVFYFTDMGTWTNQDAYVASGYASSGATWNGNLAAYKTINGTEYRSIYTNGNSVDSNISGAYLIINASFGGPSFDGQYYEGNNSQFFDITTATSFDDYGQSGTSDATPFSSIAFPQFNTTLVDPNTLADPTFGSGSGNYIANGSTWQYEVWEYRTNLFNGIKYFVGSPQTSLGVTDDGMGEAIAINGSFNAGDGDGYVIQIYNTSGFQGSIDIGASTSFTTDTITTVPVTPPISSYTGMTWNWSDYGYVTSPATKYSSVPKSYTNTDTNPSEGFIWFHQQSTFGNATDIKIIEEAPRTPGNFYSGTTVASVYQFNSGLGDATVTPNSVGFHATGQSYTYNVYSKATPNSSLIFSANHADVTAVLPNDGLFYTIGLTISAVTGASGYRIHKLTIGYEDTVSTSYQDDTSIPWNGSSTLTPTTYIFAVEILQSTISDYTTDPPLLILMNKSSGTVQNTGISWRYGGSYGAEVGRISITGDGHMKLSAVDNGFDFAVTNAGNPFVIIRNGTDTSGNTFNTQGSATSDTTFYGGSSAVLAQMSSVDNTVFFGKNAGTFPGGDPAATVAISPNGSDYALYMDGGSSSGADTTLAVIYNTSNTLQWSLSREGRMAFATAFTPLTALANVCVGPGNASYSQIVLLGTGSNMPSTPLNGGIERDDAATNGGLLHYTTGGVRRNIMLNLTTSNAGEVPRFDSNGNLVSSNAIVINTGTGIIAFNLITEFKQNATFDSGKNLTMSNNSQILGNIVHSYIGKTANYTFSPSNDYIIAATANSFNFTFPTSVGRTGQIYIPFNSGTGVTTILTTSSQTVNGISSGSITLNQNQGFMAFSDGANWKSIGVLASAIVGTLTGAQVTGAALTKTDDTNVTLTLGGTPTTALLAATSITAGWTGTLSVARGGTGASTLLGAGLSTITNVSLTNQSADITTTNLATVAGLYLVSYSLQDTTADLTAGAVILTISYTDGAGSTTSTATQTLVGVGRQSGSVYVQLASGNLTYATSHTGIFGSSKYALFITTERVN